jgi:hypothetical protein
MTDSMEKAKQPYRKPRLRTIELTAEEVLGAGCKTLAGGGVAPPSCVAGNCGLEEGS